MKNTSYRHLDISSGKAKGIFILVTLTEQVMKNTLNSQKVLNLTSFHLKVVLH